MVIQPPSCIVGFNGTNVFRIFGHERWGLKTAKKKCIASWNPKQPSINGCFNWMIPNRYVENCCFTKHWPWGSRLFRSI